MYEVNRKYYTKTSVYRLLKFSIRVDSTNFEILLVVNSRESSWIRLNSCIADMSQTHLYNIFSFLFFELYRCKWYLLFLCNYICAYIQLYLLSLPEYIIRLVWCVATTFPTLFPWYVFVVSIHNVLDSFYTTALIPVSYIKIYTFSSLFTYLLLFDYRFVHWLFFLLLFTFNLYLFFYVLFALSSLSWLIFHVTQTFFTFYVFFI